MRTPRFSHLAIVTMTAALLMLAGCPKNTKSAKAPAAGGAQTGQQQKEDKRPRVEEKYGVTSEGLGG